MADSYAQNDEPLYDQSPGQYLHVEPDEVVPSNFDNPLYFQSKNQQAKGDSGYLAVQPDWLSEQWDLLAAQPWFRGFQTREDATSELRSKPPGHFVVRVSNSEPGHYAISAVQHQGKMDHMLILPSYAGTDSNAPGHTRYRLGTYSKDLFNTVPKLIAYYIDHEYIDVRRLQGVVVQEAQQGGYMDVNPDAPSWNQGEISRQEAERQLRGKPVGGFILRSKRGQGHVLSMVVDPPKNFMHHLITMQDQEYLIDGVAVGRFASVASLVDFLQQDTLGCIATELIDVFGGDVDSWEPVASGGGDPLYDSAGTSGGGGALYDAVPGDGGGDPLYDEARDDRGAGYLGIEPQEYGEDEVAAHVADEYPYPGDNGAQYSSEPVYGDDAYGEVPYDEGDPVYGDDAYGDAVTGEPIYNDEDTIPNNGYGGAPSSYDPYNDGEPTDL